MIYTKLLKYGCLFVFLLLFQQVKNQEVYQETNSVINTYQKVREVNPDRVKVWDVSGFEVGDKVLIIQMKGATLLVDGRLDLIKNTGKYEVLVIEDIFSGSSELVFNNNLMNNYDATESVQVVKVAEYDRVNLVNEVTAPAWNDSTGGIVAIFAYHSLELQNNITVAGKGFKGGDASLDADYTGDCASTSVVYEDSYYSHLTLNRAGRKGDGIVTKNYTNTKGRGKVLNGGGGGNGKYSGGAGGGNYGVGGDGGYETATCSPPLVELRAIPGSIDDTTFYSLDDRIFFGGGGGTGTQGEGLVASTGGNGGGIVIILAEEIISNGNAILANGESVTETATAGAGGGGGGGSILLNVAKYSDDLTIEVNGGDGGHTSGAQSTGPGGGGGGGFIWHSRSALPPQLIGNVSKSGGVRGRYNGSPYGALSGSVGWEALNLVLQLNGFLFNSILNPDTTICEGDDANIMYATQPRGGDGTYTYQWQKSTDSITWTNVGTVTDSLAYPIGTLTDTTHFRRIVNSDVFADTSKTVTVFVHDLISGNVIAADQIICQGQSADTITGATYAGGNGMTYSFQWQRKRINEADFVNLMSASTLEYYKSSTLTDTSFYRRIITSGQCKSTSNEVEISVLPTIDNNSVQGDQDVCWGNTPIEITGLQPINGDGNYIYKWEESLNGTDWADATETNNQLNYQPDVLTDAAFYRRQVYSGAGNVCSSASNVVTVDVLNSIAGNAIFDSDTLCEGTAPAQIYDSELSGGNGTYSYVWESSLNETDWNKILNDVETLTLGSLYQTTYIRRWVYSGRDDVCSSTSNTLKFTVLDKIENNSIAADQVICEAEIPGALTGQIPIGGTQDFNYIWQIRSASGSWEEAQNNHVDKDYVFTYSPNPDNYLIRRFVKSDVCEDYSDSILLEVQTDIVSNLLIAPESVCKGDSPGTLVTNNLSGGNGAYEYSWESGTDSSSLQEVDSETNAGYTAPGIDVPTFYRRIVSSGSCMDTSEITRIGIIERPTGFLTDATDTICEGDSYDLNLNFTGEPDWDIYIDASGNKVSTTSANTSYVRTYTPETPLLYTISVDSIIDATGCPATDFGGEVTLLVDQFVESYAGDDDEVCGLTYTLNADPNYPGEWLYNAETINSLDPSNPLSNFESEEYGETTLQWILKNGKCVDTANVRLIFYEQPEQPSAGNDAMLNFASDYVLSASEATAGTGTWTSSNEKNWFTNENDPKTTINFDPEVFSDTLYWTIENGVCNIVYDSIIIKIKEFTTPNGFSPNNDGINDYWEVEGILGTRMPEGSKFRLTVVNRAGQEVFGNDDYDNKWDGTNNKGEELLQGIYFYILVVESPGKEDEHYTGSVTIRR